MLTALLLAFVFWFGAGLLGLPRRLRLGILLGAYVVVLLALWVLPPDAGLRQSLGGRIEPWIVVGGVGVLIAAYRFALGKLKARAKPAEEKPKGTFTEAELERYSRHMLLREVGGAGQKRLKSAKVLVVGAGGLGSPAILYLAASGVGTIMVVDDDVVEPSNLQRQIIHSDDRVGLPKVQSAMIAAKALNPFVTVLPYQRRLDEASARDLIANADIVLDGTDNFDTRYLVNRICVELGKPLLAGAIAQWEGQVALYEPARGGPCMECVFPVRPAAGLAPACAEAGVIAPLPGVVGSMMALEAVKRLTGAGDPLMGRLMIYDGLYGETRTMLAKRRADCPVCGRQHDATIG